MFRLLLNRVLVPRNPLGTLQNTLKISPTQPIHIKHDFSTLQAPQPHATLLNNPAIKDISTSITRTLTKFSLRKGKRKSVHVVTEKFYRLNWGCWIHAKCGRKKKLWKKHAARRRRLQQHVLSNAKQSTLLDNMVTNYWKKPRYYVDDPYEPYHQREEFRCTYTKPRHYIPVENVEN